MFLKKFFYSLLEYLYRFLVSVFYRVRNTMCKMLVNNLLTEIVKRRFHSLKPDQHFSAILVIFDHRFHMLQMSRCLSQAVKLPLFLLRIMIMPVLRPSLHFMSVGYDISFAVYVCMRSFFSFPLYSRQYFKIKITDSTYISGLIFFPLPVRRLSTQ